MHVRVRTDNVPLILVPINSVHSEIVTNTLKVNIFVEICWCLDENRKKSKGVGPFMPAPSGRKPANFNHFTKYRIGHKSCSSSCINEIGDTFELLPSIFEPFGQMATVNMQQIKSRKILKRYAIV